MVLPAADDVRRILARWRPGYPAARIVVLGQGADHRAYLVNGDLVVRFSIHSDPAERAADIRREGGLLRAVASSVPVPTPAPDIVLPDEACLVYRKLPGIPLIALPAAERLSFGAAAARTLGAFLTAVHGLPVHRMAGLADRDDARLAWWLGKSADAWAAVAAALPAELRRAVQAFLAAPVPPEGYQPVFCHNDLGAEHLLADPATVTLTAVIDWSDAAITDPAHDFGLLLRDLGHRALDGVIASYGHDPGDIAALRARAICFARCKAIEDLAYGLSTGRLEYADNGRTSLTWLFSPDLAAA